MPFAKTAYLAREGTARPSGSSVGENIMHFGAVRMRLTGTGSLLMSLFSLDDIKSQTLVPFTMQSSTNIQVTRLSNFNEQRAALRLRTTEINEFFRINRIILFTKEIYTSYPGTS